MSASRHLAAAGMTMAIFLAFTVPAGADDPAPHEIPDPPTHEIPDPTSGDPVARGTDLTVRTFGPSALFDYDEPLLEGERRVHAGRRQGGDCTYSGSRTIDPDTDRVSVEREIAHDASTCTMVTEVGTSAADDLDAQEAEPRTGATHTEFATPSTRTTIEADGDVVPLATRSAWHRTRYRDPPGLTVNRATTNFTWNYNGSCVTSSSGHTTNYYWLTATGWSRTSSSTSATRVCSGATTTSSSYFRNSAFCVGQPTTFTNFAPNRIRGNPTGSYTASWTTSKSGGCNSWLSFQSHAGLQ